MKKNYSTLVTLFLTFAKIGAVTFGGGYTMIPFIKSEIAEKRKYIDEKEIIEIVAVSESTPGPIAVNLATFVGYQTAGFLGAAVSTLGIVLPSFLIILLISFLGDKFSDTDIVRYAFHGIRIGVVTLILNALCSLWKHCRKDTISMILIAFAFLGTVRFKLNTFIVIAGSAFIGLAVYLITLNGRKNDIFFIIPSIFQNRGVTFGGGYAMLPLIQSEIVKKRMDHSRPSGGFYRCKRGNARTVRNQYLHLYRFGAGGCIRCTLRNPWCCAAILFNNSSDRESI